MNHTGNYRLSLWDAADRILMSGFNADNSKTDAALKAQADAISGLEDSVADMVDAIIMPISVATIASRNCELEHKGTPLKPLETMASPGALYAVRKSLGAGPQLTSPKVWPYRLSV